MNFKIIPYVEVDGIRTAADSDVKQLYRKTVEDELDKIIFYEGTVTNECEFLRMAKEPGTVFYFLRDGNQTIGYTWLNRWENRTARQHFCVFKEYWGKTIDIGKFVLDKFLHMKDQGGEYAVDLLTGYVPAWNKRAINFALKCGGMTHGEIPNAVYNHAAGKSEPAVFIYYTRGLEGGKT